MSDPRTDLEFEGRYREGPGAPDDQTVRAIAAGVREIDRLCAQCDRLVKRLRDAGLSTPFEALNGDEQMERNKP